MLLKEIADLLPYEFENSGDGAVFHDKVGNKIGVVFENSTLKLQTRSLFISNVAFGVLAEGAKNTSENLDQSLTNAGDIRKVISTVGEIISSNSEVRDEADLVILAGADKAAKRRAQIYLVAFLDIKDKKKMPRFYRADEIKFPNSVIAVIASSTDLTQEELEFVKDNLKLEKA
jgi:hypothetical protein